MANKKTNMFKKIEVKSQVYIIIIAILLLLICYENTIYIIPAILAFIAVSIYTVFLSIKRKGEMLDYIDELTLSMDEMAKNTLINSPFAAIVMEKQGNIIWKSAKFKKEFANIAIKPYIETLAKEVTLNSLEDKNKIFDKEIPIEEKTFRVIGNYVKSKERKRNIKDISVLYFIDITENKQLLEKYNNTQSCVGIITIDNYDEIIQRIPAEEKAQIVSKIENKLYEWANSVGGLMVKRERDNFVFIFNQGYLKQMQEEKFSILDFVRDLNVENNMTVTLSIAISNEGETNSEKYESATIAMDVALGRGGDQAVIRENGKYVFFGGVVQEVEKRTKVKARMVSHALEELINKAENVIIMGHTNSDIDALGASIGILKYAYSLNKPANIVINSYISSLQNVIDEIKEQEEYENVIIEKSEALSKTTENTLLVVVDTHKKSFVDVPELLGKTEKVVIIDHHRRAEDYLDNVILAFHEAYASSASELVTEILEFATDKLNLNQLDAEALYAGIMMDTKNFTFKTGVRTFEAAAFLRKFGIDNIKVKKWFQSDLQSYNIIADVVKKAEVFYEKIGIAIYEERDKNATLICAKVADELLTINNFTTSFVLGNCGDKICISGRSIGDINVQVILEKLGGGGHITVAGAQIEGITVEEAKEKLLEKIKEYFDELA